MRKLVLAALLLLPLLAVSQSGRRPHTARTRAGIRQQGAVLEVSGPCAVLYAPSTAKTAVLRQRYGESNFSTSTDDNLTYSTKAKAFLQAKGIRVIETTAPQLRFTTSAGTTTTLDLSSPAYSWGLLLFNGRTAPQEANFADPAVDVQTVLKK